MTRRRHGFTLIELLLAMGMVAMLTLSLYAGLSTAFRARIVVNAQTDTLRQAKAALDLAEQDLRSILPPGGVLAGPFVGTPGGTGDNAAATIDCYTLGSDYLTQPGATNVEGMRHVLLAMASDAAVPTLTRTVTRDLMSPTGGTADTEVLARNVLGFAASYYDGTNWTNTWDSTQSNNALPVAVELTVSVKAPTAGDPEHIYRMKRIIPLACGLTADQAAALAAAATAASTSPDTTQ